MSNVFVRATVCNANVIKFLTERNPGISRHVQDGDGKGKSLVKHVFRVNFAREHCLHFLGGGVQLPALASDGILRLVMLTWQYHSDTQSHNFALTTNSHILVPTVGCQ
eukprot:2008142-Amphidinium_carterae.1